MTCPDSRQDRGLGGRLPLLDPSHLEPNIAEVHRQLSDLVVPEADRGGYTARLEDGRLIGPFNAMLRTPALTLGFGRWVAQIGDCGLAEDVREAVILTVGAAWNAPFEIYAHTAAGVRAGLPTAAVDAILSGRVPCGLSEDAEAAQRLAVDLLARRITTDETYESCLSRFGERGLIALLHLIGQYQVISLLLTCFRVPAPSLTATRASAPS